MANNQAKEQSCAICLDDLKDEELIKLGGSNYCKNCLSKYIASEFEEKGKSFLNIPYPTPMSGVFSMEEFRKYGSESSITELDMVLKTIPAHPEDPNLKLSDFNYDYNTEGELVHRESGKRFHWVNQPHYDLLGDTIVPYIQKRMVSEFDMEEIRLPLQNHITKPLPEHVYSNIFMTKDALTNSKLMLIIQGSGAVRPGQWARALCINDKLKNGTILPYLEKAIQLGFGVIVFNPNQNSIPEDPLKSRPSYQDLFVANPPKSNSNANSGRIPIPFNTNPGEHTLYVWDNFVRDSKAKEIVIVAHSAGGHCTTHLLNNRTKEVLPRVKCIAFTDSVHSVSPRDSKEVARFLVDNAINWVQSSKTLDAEEKKAEKYSGCRCVSAGHEKHEFTSGYAIESVFEFIKENTSSSKK